MTKRKANIYLLISAMISGGGYIAGKIALTGLSPIAIIALRFLLGAVVIGVAFRTIIFPAKKSVVIQGLCIGIMHLVALLFQLVGLQYTTPAKQSFLCTAYVVLVPFLAWLLFRKQLRVRQIVAGLIALVGIAIVSLNESLTIGKGELLSLCFAVCFATQIVLVDHFTSPEISSTALSFFQFLGAGCVGLMISLFTKTSLIPATGASIMGILYVGVLNTALAYGLQNTGQRYSPPGTAALILGLESVFGFLFSVLWYHQMPGIRLLAGGTLCVVAIILSSKE